VKGRVAVEERGADDVKARCAVSGRKQACRRAPAMLARCMTGWDRTTVRYALTPAHSYPPFLLKGVWITLSKARQPADAKGIPLDASWRARLSPAWRYLKSFVSSSTDCPPFFESVRRAASSIRKRPPSNALSSA